MSNIHKYKGFTFEWDDELNQYAVKSDEHTLGNIEYVSTIREAKTWINATLRYISESEKWTPYQ